MHIPASVPKFGSLGLGPDCLANTDLMRHNLVFPGVGAALFYEHRYTYTSQLSTSE